MYSNLVSVLCYCCSFGCIIICNLLFVFQNLSLSEAFFSLSGSFDWKTLGVIQSFLIPQYPYLSSVFAFLSYCLLFCSEQTNK